MANFTGRQKKLLAAGSAAAVLVLVLGIAVFTLGGGNAETPPAAPQGSQPEATVSDVPQPEVTPPEVSVPVAETPGADTPSPDPVLNVEEENHVEVNLSEFEKPEAPPEPPKAKDEGALTNPEQPPVYEDEQKVVEPSSAAPQNGQKQDGAIYIEGFGWIKDEGGGTIQQEFHSDGDINKQVGYMGN